MSWRSKAAPSNWESEALFSDGDAYFKALLMEIDGARDSVEFESYIFEDDQLGARVVSALLAAAGRGVRVRLIVDGLGSPAFSPERVRSLTEKGVLTRVFHPLPWKLPFLPLRSLLTALLKLNQRNHRKVCVVDKRAAWVGSLNVSVHHLREFDGERAWSDLSARVEGSGIVELERAFERAWLRAKGFGTCSKEKFRYRLAAKFPERRSRAELPRLVRLNSTRSARRRQYRDLLRRIANARERVWITNAYFAPEFRLMRAMKVAAAAGVDVRLIVPRKSDIFFMPWVTAAHYSRLLKIGVRIYEYLPRFLHAKSLIIDEFAMVGSTNLNHRSLLHDLEADVVLRHPDTLTSLEARFRGDLSRSAEARIEQWRALPWIRRAIGRVLLAFRYWL